MTTNLGVGVGGQELLQLVGSVEISLENSQATRNRTTILLWTAELCSESSDRSFHQRCRSHGDIDLI